MYNFTDEQIQTAWNKFDDFDRVQECVIPVPTRMFEVGDECQVGALKNCEIAEIYYEGKAYRVNVTAVDNNYGNPIESVDTRVYWWFDVEDHRTDANRDNPELFSDHLPGQLTMSSLDGLLHLMSYSGLVCDPRYQRGYVWSDTDQEALIDSIFNRMSIGSIILSRHAGFNHDDSTRTVKYINLDGKEVEVPEADDYSCAVIDGQQRLTTIWRFFTNQFMYKGLYYKDLNFRDQGNFNNTLISQRIFEERSVPYKDVLRMFIKTNRGVPQDNSHLDAVQKRLDELE